MTRPIKGTYYTVQEGDDYPKIALRAYGIAEKWTLIRDANQLQYKTTNLEQVNPGEQLFIPSDPELIEIKQQ